MDGFQRRGRVATQLGSHKCTDLVREFETDKILAAGEEKEEPAAIDTLGQPCEMGKTLQPPIKSLMKEITREPVVRIAPAMPAMIAAAPYIPYRPSLRCFRGRVSRPSAD